MDLLDRELREWVLSAAAFLCGAIGMLWALSTARRAKNESRIAWPLTWKWVAAIREVVLSLFFLHVAFFIFFRAYDWRLYGLALTAVAGMKLYVLRRWMLLDFPPEVPRPAGSRGYLVEQIDRGVALGITLLLGIILGAIIA